MSRWRFPFVLMMACALSLLAACGGGSGGTPVPALASIQLNPAAASLPVGLTQQYSATGLYSDGRSEDITRRVAWRSSQPAQATIDDSGLATAVATGAPLITASLDGVVSAASALTVTPAALVSISVTPVAPRVGVGATQPFAAIGRYTDRSSADITSAVSWHSADAARATIAAGTATGVATGVAGISAALDGVSSNLATLYVTGVTAPMAVSRREHTATLLRDGRVLVAGGVGGGAYRAGCELYDPVTGTWSPTGSMLVARGAHTATLLADGRVLVAGGYGTTTSAEIYDPATGGWQAAGAMAEARSGHTATLLADGRVLVVGGTPPVPFQPETGNELFDPATGTWRPAARMALPRYKHAAVRLADGRVLAVGGRTGNTTPVGISEIFDPATDSWSSAGALVTPRSDHAALLLPDGRVLAVAGYEWDYLASIEVFDPATGLWAIHGSIATGRMWHSATLLTDGRVLVLGGYGSVGGGVVGPLASAELYEPGSHTASPTGPLADGRPWHGATRLGNGLVLVTGGGSGDGLASSELR